MWQVDSATTRGSANIWWEPLLKQLFPRGISCDSASGSVWSWIHIKHEHTGARQIFVFLTQMMFQRTTESISCESLRQLIFLRGRVSAFILIQFIISCLAACNMHKIKFITGKGRNQSSMELQPELNSYKYGFCLPRGGRFQWTPGACLFVHPDPSSLAFQHFRPTSISWCPSFSFSFLIFRGYTDYLWSTSFFQFKNTKIHSNSIKGLRFLCIFVFGANLTTLPQRLVPPYEDG